MICVTSSMTLTLLMCVYVQIQSMLIIYFMVD